MSFQGKQIPIEVEKIVVQLKKHFDNEKKDHRFEYGSPLAAVQKDLMQVVLAGGQVLHIVTLLDDFSRFVLVTMFIAVKTMDEVIKYRGHHTYLLASASNAFK